jgi:predicted RNase H-like HicB family nuclease
MKGLEQGFLEAAFHLLSRLGILEPMKYKIALEESEEGFSVSVPGLPGCWSQGATEEEAVENIQDAIREYLAAVDDLLEGRKVREIDVAV